MKIDNRKSLFYIWLSKLITTIVVALLGITFGLSDFFKTPVLGIDKTWYMTALLIVYLLYSLYNFMKRPNYVSYSDNGDKIVLRFYPVRIMNSKKNSIEIPKNHFVSWKTERFFFGMFEKLYVYAKFKSGLAKYPGISLSAVSAGDRERIKSALKSFEKKEN